jgi:hypothetical protein
MIILSSLAPASGSAGQDALQLVEAVRPTLAVECEPGLGLERALGENELRRVTYVPEREANVRLDVVGSGVLPDEREGEAAWRIDLANSPARWKRSPSGGCISIR